jgi:hypothetical protein
MAELFGKKTGSCRGQGGSMHIFSSKVTWGQGEDEGQGLRVRGDGVSRYCVMLRGARA